LRCSAHDNWFPSKFWFVALFDGRIESIHINMEDHDEMGLLLHVRFWNLELALTVTDCDIGKACSVI
jgi:hypothetical protein